MNRAIERSLLIALSILALAILYPLQFYGNPDQATVIGQAQDSETRMFVNDTWLSNLELFSAWGEPRFAMPSAPVYNVGTGVIVDEEEIVICNSEGFISSYRVQTEDRILWTRELREGTPGGDDIIGFVMDDFTGDNLDDLIVIEGIISPIAGGLFFHENLGNGSFAFPGIRLAGAFPTAAGDFNGDGEMDLFGLTFQSDGWILWNVSEAISGNLGDYWERVLVLDPHQSVNYHTISAGDIDNDDRDEVLVLADFTVQEAYIFEFLDNGSFVRKQNLGYIGHQTYSVFGDVDGDGWLDLVISDFASNVYYLPNLGNGTLTPIASGQWLAFAPKAGAVALMDIDQDAKDDLIIVGQGYNEVMFFWTSYIPPAETKDSNGSGLALIEAIAVVAIPITLLAIRSKRQQNRFDH